ncbi:toxin-antitoxin system YwqK family antitoxin [Myxococcus llanfairpwllgwyngyllgogerychwyrndrobwllllantysiliogogogochensis]|uniref:toxin-antitoxin system YwqK family antitoxin n=1 Tax=Myxococcus llanfairpwllgwyngyllgogerychwyrndrobwllllantysiliogogogochensis TaxID=2590453 RepID=UPI001C66614C|nr:hypothetical protein [Myxococcus llanfairpwllgwyngyllgogerychwyrndrobwllllantysiliogogogochensis]
MLLLLWRELSWVARGQQACSRLQVLALAFVPGYSLVGLPRFFATLVEPRARRAITPWAILVGLVGPHLLLIGALVAEAWTSTSGWTLAVPLFDGALLLAQTVLLLGAYRVLSQRASTPPAPEPRAEEELAPEAPPEPPPTEDTGLDCPECVWAARLYRAPGRIGAHCLGCEGDLLSPMEQARWLPELGATGTPLEETGRQVRCVSCEAYVTTVMLPGGAVSPCTACGVVWMRAGMLHRLTQGQQGRPRARRPVPAPAREPWMPPLLSPLASGVVVAVCVFGGAAFVTMRARPPVCDPGTTLQREEREDGWVLRQCVNETGQRDGAAWLRDTRGRLREKTAWTKGRRSGAHHAWDATGQLRTEGLYQDDLPLGEWSRYTEEGMRFSRASWSKGLLHGEVVDVADSGLPHERRNYSQGVLDGPYTLYFTGGGRKVEGTYARGLRHGSWTRYGTTGAPLESVLWNQGEPTLVLEDEPGTSLASRGGARRGPDELLYGGRSLDWWNRRLRQLWPRREESDRAARYSLTVHRAGLNGLKVQETTAGPRVLVATPDLETPVSVDTP